MGLFDFIRRLLGGAPQSSSQPKIPAPTSADPAKTSAPAPAQETLVQRTHSGEKKPWRPVRLVPLDYEPSLVPTPPEAEHVPHKPYRFAFIGARRGEYLDLSKDGDDRWLDYYGLPSLQTPDDLAAWLGISIGRLAWLTHRTEDGHRAPSKEKSHYVYTWVKKRSGTERLIESPKSELKRVQQQILRQILDQVPAHPKAHGFVTGRSIVTNARPHVNKRFILKFDLKDFYPSVRYSRVVAIYRSLGFSREVSIWLSRLTTNAVPWGVAPTSGRWDLTNYWGRHLPQGAPTSPALANLSAFALDVRLAGLAEKYCLAYTRYADDLTFSGRGKSVPALREFIPLVAKIIRAEKFTINFDKRRILRNNQRQTVAGVVVNERPNISRRNFDQLKAILYNCIKQGPRSQNREQHPAFSAHLRGRIAHVMQLNPQRGLKLLKLYEQIDWSR